MSGAEEPRESVRVFTHYMIIDRLSKAMELAMTLQLGRWKVSRKARELFNANVYSFEKHIGASRVFSDAFARPYVRNRC